MHILLHKGKQRVKLMFIADNGRDVLEIVDITEGFNNMTEDEQKALTATPILGAFMPETKGAA